MPSMTLQEFQEQATRLHRRYPHAYPYRKQVELAWHVQGLSLEWFKTRVDYVIRSGSPAYDWKNSAAVALKASVILKAPILHEGLDLENVEPGSVVLFKEFKDQITQQIVDATGIPAEKYELHDSKNIECRSSEAAIANFEEWLKTQGANSAVDLLLARWKSKEHADEK
nr:hypothetical protein CKG001_10440 [Bdellovibrio sp. CKG001]